jgi:hypothetical protein
MYEVNATVFGDSRYLVVSMHTCFVASRLQVADAFDTYGHSRMDTAGKESAYTVQMRVQGGFDRFQKVHGMPVLYGTSSVEMKAGY